MIAHVLTANPVPLPLQWLTAVLLVGGIFGALALRRPAWRRAAAGAALLGTCGTIAVWVAGALQPGAPPYALRIAFPTPGTRVSAPLYVTVCGVRRDGSRLPAGDPQHLLVVFVDGHEVATVNHYLFPVDLRDGTHSIRVELVNQQHHAFTPPAATSTTVIVAGAAPATVLPGC